MIFESWIEPEDVTSSDSGMSLDFSIDEDHVEAGDSVAMHVDVVSWDESRLHLKMQEWIGKRVRVTVENVDA